MSSEILAAIEKTGRAFDEFKSVQDQRLDKLGQRIDGVLDRIEDIEAKQKTPGRTAGDGLKGAPGAFYELRGPNEAKSYVVSREQKLASIPDLQAKAPVSMERWCAALVLGSGCGDKEALEAVHESKSLATTTTGALVPAAYVPEWIDMARSQSVLARAGMRTVTMMDKTLTYSHQTADPTFSWQSSEGASLSATDPTFAARTLTAKTIAVRTQVSLEASMDIPDFGRQIVRAYTAAFGQAIDQAGIRGTSPAPTGLQTLSGVTAVASGGSQSDYDKMVDAVVAFLNANNSLEQLTAIITHPTMLGRYNKIKTGLSGDKTVLAKPPLLENVPWLTTTHNDASASPQTYIAELGNFDDLVCGVRMNPTIRLLDGTTSMASNLLVEIVGVARIDIVAVRPASFVRLTGLTAS